METSWLTICSQLATILGVLITIIELTITVIGLIIAAIGLIIAYLMLRRQIKNSETKIDGIAKVVYNIKQSFTLIKGDIVNFILLERAIDQEQLQKDFNDFVDRLSS